MLCGAVILVLVYLIFRGKTTEGVTLPSGAPRWLRQYSRPGRVVRRVVGQPDTFGRQRPRPFRGAKKGDPYLYDTLRRRPIPPGSWLMRKYGQFFKEAADQKFDPAEVAKGGKGNKRPNRSLFRDKPADPPVITRKYNVESGRQEFFDEKTQTFLPVRKNRESFRLFIAERNRYNEEKKAHYRWKSQKRAKSLQAGRRVKR